MAIILDVYLLSEAFLTMILYIWSRRNKNTVLHIFGLFPLKAPYVTWFIFIVNIDLLGIQRFFVLLQLLLGEGILSDLLGIIIGHIYYFFVDIYPKLPLSKDCKVLDPPPSIL